MASIEIISQLDDIINVSTRCIEILKLSPKILGLTFSQGGSMNRVIKRNGQEVPFEIEKIKKAISGANEEVDGSDKISEISLNEIVDEIEKECEKIPHALNVESIQDIVEKVIMDEGYFEVARRYIKYRFLHDMIRNKYKALIEETSKRLNAADIQNQNANVDEASFGGRQGEASNYLTSQYALDYCMSKMARENHLNNEIYTHDLSSYAIGCHNCLTIPFDDLLANGFDTRQTDVRPAQSVNTAFQLIAVIFQIQSLQQFGGVSASHLDWTMVPYVRKSFRKHYHDGKKYFYLDNEKGMIMDIADEACLAKDDFSIIDPIFNKYYPKAYKYAIDMTEREVHQAVEGMYHNLNTLQSRSGNQLPFTSINYGTCTLPEGRMITKALLEVSIDGIGSLHRTSIFPCGIFQVMKGVNKEPGTPNYDLYRLALKSTAQRLYPNYANVDWSGNEGYDKNDPRTYFSTMGKRKLQLM